MSKVLKCLTLENKKKFKAERCIVIDNFVPHTLLEEVLKASVAATTFRQITQVREKHFTHVFANDQKQLPDTGEEYRTSFNKSVELSNNEAVQEIFHSYIVPACAFFTEGKAKYFTDPMCYKMTSGDFMRVHNDLYGGIIGYNLYYPKQWKWDWGGIVNYYMTKDEVRQIFPEFNRMVFRDESHNLPHFVSLIPPYALEDRFAINGWGCPSRPNIRKGIWVLFKL